MNVLAQTFAIAFKDLRSELRTRYAVNALLMFVVTSVATILFALREDRVGTDVLSGMYWVVVFFSGMAGLSRIFVGEEERGTTLTLRLIASSSAVYFGKLLFNCLQTILLVLAATVLYLIAFPEFVIRSAALFAATVFLGSLGFAAAATVIAAIVAKAQAKGTLYTVLSFPILAPLLLTVIQTTAMALDGAEFSAALGQFQILFGYICAVVGLSFILFDYIWKD